MPCANSATAAVAAPRFSIGDIVEVFGTGIGLRAWQNTCTGSYVVKPDNTIGIIQDAAQCCGGYVRWRIRYVGDTVDRWSAEGDPDTGVFWLWKITSTYTVSGTVTLGGSPLSGVQMQGLPGNPSTDESGFYSAAVSVGSSFTVTPVKAGYAFSPATWPYSSIGANQTNQNYTATATPTSFTIHGYFTLGQFAMNEDVWMYASPSVPGSPFHGYDEYIVTVPAGWSGTVTPVSEGYTFGPSSRSYSNVSADDYSDNDYAASVVGPGQTTLIVNIAPQEAIDGGAGWKLEWSKNGSVGGWELNYRTSGETAVLDYYNADTFVIQYKYVNSGDWNTPVDQAIPYVPGTSRTITATYSRKAGSVTVTINPAAARNAGAQWRVAGGPWRDSGYTEQNVLIGQQVVEFKPVAGWLHPANRVVSIANFDTVNIADTYIDQGTGPLIVSVSPGSGPLEGGTGVTISGANFVEPASVSFGGVAATQITVVSGMEIRAKTPARPTIGSVDVAVTIAGATTTKPNAFSYLAGIGNGMRLVGQIGGTVNAVAVQGNYAYIGEGPNFVVLNISSRANPVRVGGLLLDGLVFGIAVSGTRAYVAANDRGLYTIDIANPAAPAVLGVYDTPGYAVNVKELGGFVYIADYDGGLLVFDVSDPAKPILLGSQSGIGRVKGLDFAIRPEGLFAYVTTDYDQRLHIIDVSDPYAPVLRGNYHFGSDAKNVDVVWPYAYVAAFFDRLRIIDISDPDNPTQTGYYVDGPLTGNDVKVVGNRAYIVGSGLAIVNVNDPANPQSIATFSDLSFYASIGVDGGYAFVADGENGLKILAVANAPPVSLAGQYASTAMSAQAIAFRNGLAFVGAANSGLHLIDVSNPTAPALRGVFGFHDAIYDIALDGNFAYLATGTSLNGLRVVDVTNPAAPVARGTLSGDIYLGLTIANGYLWTAGEELTTYHSVLQAFGLNNRDAPPLVGSLSLGANNTGFDVVIQGGFAYYCDPNRGLYVIDVSTPNAPTSRSFFSIDGGARSASVHSLRAFVSDSAWNMRILDVSNPNAPSLIGTSAFPTGSAVSSFVSDGLLYVSGGADFGVRVYDLIDPSADPPFIASFNTAGAAFASFVADELVYVADVFGGLSILELLDFRPPTLFITNPTFSPTYATSASTINLGGAASDDRGVAQVTWSNHRGGSGTANGTDSWTVTGIVLNPGTNIISVTAYDEQGNVGSDVLTVTYNAPADIEAPSIHITAPTPLATYTTGASSVALSGTASDNREVTQVTWLNSRGGSGNATGTSTWSINGIPLFTGENILTVTAYDAANNPGTATLTVTVTDADADGVADDDDACPNTIPGVPVDSSGCPPFIPGDFDSDGDVDLHDLTKLPGCLSGPATQNANLGCARFDVNADQRIDLIDLSQFQRCFSGSNVQAGCRD